MKRSLALPLITCLSVIFAASAGAQQSLKVGVVDMTRVFGEFHKTKAIETDLKTHQEEARKEVEGQETQLRDMAKKLDALRKGANDPANSATVRTTKQNQLEALSEEARALQSTLLDFARRREMQLIEMFNREREKILLEISAAVTKRATAEGYDLVFDRSARSTREVPFLLYSKDARDFSAEMITELNKK